MDREYTAIKAQLDRLELGRQKDHLLMQALIDQNKMLREQLDKMTQMLVSLQSAGIAGVLDATTTEDSLRQDQWLDNQDLCDLLKVTPRSLQRYRSDGLLPYKLLHKKSFYSKEDVLKFLETNTVKVDKANVMLYFAKLGISA